MPAHAWVLVPYQGLHVQHSDYGVEYMDKRGNNFKFKYKLFKGNSKNRLN